MILQNTGPLESEATSSTTSWSFPPEGGDHPEIKGHSDSPTDSIALMITVSVRTIQAKLEVACSGGVVDVFSTTGRHKAIFPVAYQEYSNEVSRLEGNISCYLKVGNYHYQTTTVIYLLWNVNSLSLSHCRLSLLRFLPQREHWISCLGLNLSPLVLL